MWKLTENKAPKGQQELRVKILLREMSEYSYATNAQEFENHFKNRIKEIPRTNNYSADLLYGVKYHDQKLVEIWKKKVTGEFNYKMFTVEYVELPF